MTVTTFSFSEIIPHLKGKQISRRRGNPWECDEVAAHNPQKGTPGMCPSMETTFDKASAFTRELFKGD